MASLDRRQWRRRRAEIPDRRFASAARPHARGLLSQNKVVEYDADRNKVWELNNVNQPWGADGLPNGHRLICSYNGQFVAEYDESGKEVWRKDGLPGFASHAHRLDDGNTLVACSNVNKVIEI